MKQALCEADDALLEGEVPIGAVVVMENKVIARGHNRTQRLNDVTAHAEMVGSRGQHFHLGMGGHIIQPLGAVVPAGNHLVFHHHHRPDGHLALQQGIIGLA